MKNKALNILFATALSAGCFLGIAKVSAKHVQEPVIERVEAAEGNYYSGISDSLSGEDLLNALHTLNNQKRTKTVGYAGFRQFAATCDADPDGSGKIIGFYDNKKVGPSWDSGSTWNREHVWPNVRDGDKVENDAHMVRPAATSTNSNRGSKGFGTDSYDPGEYVAYYRGAAARIVFYAAIADTSLKVVDYSFPYDGVGSGNHGYAVGTMGSLSDMLRWNLEYLPSDTSFTGANDLARRTELSRNEKIQTASGGQGNRNPFIDHPEYACKIWGNTNATTKQICGASTDPTVTKVTVAPSSVRLDLQEHSTQDLTATVTGNNNPDTTVTWSTNNSSVATVSSSGLVTAHAIGTATITATSTFDTTKKGTCTVSVTAEPAPTVTSVTLNKTSLSFDLSGERSETLTATVTGTHDPATTVTWTSNNNSVASVDNGVVTANAVGTATITAASTVDPTKKATCSVTVTDSTVIRISDTELDLEVGAQASIYATAMDGGKITWTVDKAGAKALHLYESETASDAPLHLYGIKNGTATVTATCSTGESVTCVVKVGTGVAKKENNLPLIIGLSAGGGTLVLGGLIVLIVLLVKKKPV